MKIGMLVPGGVDRSGTHRVIPCLLWLIERLARDHELHVFAFRQEPTRGSWDLHGARVHNVGPRPRRPRMAATIAAEHRRGRFDVLHAVWASPPGVVAAAVGRLLGVPVLLHLTGGDLASLPEIGYGLCRTRRGRTWLRVAVRGATAVTVPSASMQRAAEGRGIRAERVPMGVALDRWPVRPPEPRCPGAPARLLNVGSLNRVKDQTTLVRAARALEDQELDFELEIVGEDTLEGAVQSEADARGAKRVRFLGFLPHGELRTRVERAHVLVVSSRHEADPIVALEAAVAGVPVVGTSVGHVQDWAPSAAVAVPVADPLALATAISGLLADDARRVEVARCGQRRAVEEDANWTAARVAELYRTLVTGTPGGLA